MDAKQYLLYRGKRQISIELVIVIELMATPFRVERAKSERKAKVLCRPLSSECTDRL